MRKRYLFETMFTDGMYLDKLNTLFSTDRHFVKYPLPQTLVAICIWNLCICLVQTAGCFGPDLNGICNLS